MTFLPSVVRAEYRGGYTIHLTFNDGLARAVDFGRRIKDPVFEPLRDPAYFCQVAVDPELGTIVWPNGADVAPETLVTPAAVREERASAIQAMRGRS